MSALEWPEDDRSAHATLRYALLVRMQREQRKRTEQALSFLIGDGYAPLDGPVLTGKGAVEASKAFGHRMTEVLNEIAQTAGSVPMREGIVDQSMRHGNKPPRHDGGVG